MSHLAKAMSNFVSHSTGAPCYHSPSRAPWRLSAGRRDQVEVMRCAFEERRNLIVDRMNAIPGVSCLKPEGAFYIMMNLQPADWARRSTA